MTTYGKTTETDTLLGVEDGALMTMLALFLFFIFFLFSPQAMG